MYWFSTCGGAFRTSCTLPGHAITRAALEPPTILLCSVMVTPSFERACYLVDKNFATPQTVEHSSEEKILEKDIEAYLVKQVKKRGGLAFKFVSPAHRGVPDRVLIMPGGVVIFVEVKAETGRLSALQNQTISEMRAVGARVCVVWSRSDVDELMGTL
jgi:hypothetical protein